MFISFFTSFFLLLFCQLDAVAPRDCRVLGHIRRITHRPRNQSKTGSSRVSTGRPLRRHRTMKLSAILVPLRSAVPHSTTHGIPIFPKLRGQSMPKPPNLGSHMEESRETVALRRDGGRRMQCIPCSSAEAYSTTILVT
jgi:hypothetical protein